MDAKKCTLCEHRSICSIWASAKRFLVKQAEDSTENGDLPSDANLTEAYAVTAMATAYLCYHYKQK